MCAFYGLIASEVTHVHRNCVSVFVRACVCMRTGGLAHVCLRGEKVYSCIIIIKYKINNHTSEEQLTRVAQASKKITERRLNCMVRACDEERWRTHRPTEESVKGGYTREKEERTTENKTERRVSRRFEKYWTESGRGGDGQLHHMTYMTIPV